MRISDKPSPKAKQASKAGASAGVNRASPSRGAAAGGFKVETTQQSGSSAIAPAGPDSAGPVDALQALIDLQSSAKTSSKDRRRQTLLTAGQQTLTLLERLQQGLLTGRIYKNDLKSLSEQTGQTARLLAEADADPDLAGLYEDIALRARIELAKLER